jgi:hypothetical protein
MTNGMGEGAFIVQKNVKMEISYLAPHALLCISVFQWKFLAAFSLAVRPIHESSCPSSVR